MAGSERQAELIETHRSIQEAALPYVLIGGWAVSAYQVRTTMDIDMVIPRASLPEYEPRLGDLRWEKRGERKVSNVYEGKILQYEKAVGDHSVTFNLLVGAVRCRQTDAEWSYDYLERNSIVAPLRVAPDLRARIPEPALLFAMKLHSGRRADARDHVVVGTMADFETVLEHVDRGDRERLRGRIESVVAEMDDEHFRDSFHGAFRQTGFSESDADEVQAFLRELNADR